MVMHVLAAICHMVPAYIKWPSICHKHICAGIFARWTGIDNLIGAIDGCQMSPKQWCLTKNENVNSFKNWRQNLTNSR